MKAVIVDDEPNAIELIKDYLSHFSSVQLVASFRNGVKALDYLLNNPVDLIFLDINMPHLSGIALSKMINDDVMIVFTTAYSEYAVESYDVAAVDYLMKPITLERFSKAMARVMEIDDSNNKDKSFIWLKSGSKHVKLAITDILYLEKDGNYMTYHTSKDKILGRETIKEALDKLPTYFCQVNKSFIVNTQNVSAIKNDRLYIDDKEIAISPKYSINISKTIIDYPDSDQGKN